MKQVLFFATFAIVFSAFVNAQTPHTLQFSRAILVSSQQTVPSIAGGDSYDAVWKVVSVLPSSNSVITNYNGSPTVGSYAITVNSNSIYTSKVTASHYNGYSGNNQTFSSPDAANLFPMWLPGGTTLAAGTNVQYVSVIEFIVN